MSVFTNSRISKALSALCGASLAMLSCTAHGLVLHPEDDVPPVEFTPLDAVLGAVNNNPVSNSINGSAVAIAPDYALLSRHQGGSVSAGTQITFDGVIYRVAELILAPNGEDFRIARLETLGGQPAQLTEYVSIYTGRQEFGKTVVLGGYGLGRGADVLRFPSVPSSPVAGYEWAGPRELRWGANVVSSTDDDFTVGSFTNDTLQARFASPTSSINGEATIASGDSGGGWFIFEDGQWFVAALNQAVEDEDVNDSVEKALFSPRQERMWGVRLSSYNTFINSSILDLGDLNGSGEVNNGDISAFLLALNNPIDYASEFPDLDPDILGDFNGDGSLNNSDISGFVDLLTGNGSIGASGSGPGAAVPEPATLTLLGLGGIMAMRRRRAT